MTDTITTAEPTVDEVMGQLVTELGGSLGVLLTALGVRAGLWAALEGAGPVTPAALADRTGVAPALVREWLRSQAAAGYLRYDPDGGTFAMPAAVGVAMLHGPGGAMVDACSRMFSSIGAGFDDFAAAFVGDGGFAWHRRTEDYWHGTDLLTRAVLPAGQVDALLDALDVDPAGPVADVGCGYGSPTLAVAAHYPAARVLGIDYHDVSVAHARAAAQRAGLGDRVRFEVAAATDLPGSGYALVTFFDSLHDLGDPIGALHQARRALAPGGAVLLVEPLAQDQVEENLNPVGRMFYAVSTMVCTPNALSQRAASDPDPLGTLAGESRLRDVAAAAGFTRIDRLGADAALNLALRLRV